MKRKFIFLAIMLLTLMGGAKWNVLNAQEGVYRIKSNSTGKYMHVFNTTTHQTGAVGGLGAYEYDEENLKQVFRFIPGDNGGYYLQCVSNNCYIKCWEWNVDALSSYSTELFGFNFDGESFSISNINVYKGGISTYFKTEYVSGNYYIFCDVTEGASNVDTYTLEQIPAPAAPTNLVVTNVTYNSVSLSWTDENNATKYRIYKDGAFAGETTEKTYTVTDLEGETTYNFTVKSVSIYTNESEDSNTATATTLVAPKTRDIVFELHDTYGDSWNNNYLRVSYDGIQAYTLTNEDLDNQSNSYTGGETQTITKKIPEGTLVKVEYVNAGSYPTENKIKIYYADGTLINGQSIVEATGATYNFLITEFTVESSTPSLTVNVESIAFGYVRLGNYWSEKNNIAVPVTIEAKNTEITNISKDNDFFIMPDFNLPATNIEFELICDVANGEAKEYTADLTIEYGENGDKVVIPVTATAYNAVTPDAIELKKDVTFAEGVYTDTPDFATLHDDYNLPKEVNAGSTPDAVYHFTMGEDGVLTVNVTGTNAIAAVYKAEDMEGSGPMANNDYKGGVAGPAANTTFLFDFQDQSLDAFNLIDANNDGKNWEIGNKYNSDIYYVMSYSWQNSSSITPDNYIVTKEAYAITAASKLTYKVNAVTGSTDYYAVVVSTDGTNFDPIFEEGYNSSTQVDREVDLSKYAGQELYIGFRHYNCTGQYYIVIDDFKLTDGSAKSRSLARSTEPQINAVQYPVGEYYLVAAAEDAFTVTIETGSLPAPSEFAYIAPENGAREQNNPILTWEAAQYATEYQVLMGTDKDNLVVVKDWSSDGMTYYQTSNLNNNTRYYWQVNVKNATATTNGEIWSFVTTMDVPSDLKVLCDDEEIGQFVTENSILVLTWNAIEAAKAYKVYRIQSDVEMELETVENNTYEIAAEYDNEGSKYAVSAIFEGELESDKTYTEYIYVLGNGSFKGYVTDGTNPIANLTFELAGTNAIGEDISILTTDENGYFEGEILEGNDYTLTISHYDYEEFVMPVEIVYDEEYDFGTIVLIAKPSVEDIEVTATDNGEYANVTWTGSYEKYNVYRRNIEDPQEIELLGEVAASPYTDNEWAELEDGTYQYGVSTFVEEQTQSRGEEVIFEEGFENNGSFPEGWTRYSQNNYNNWTIVTDKSYSETYCAQMYSYSSSIYDRWLRTKEIELNNISSPTLKFYYKHQQYQSYSTPNTFNVKVKGEDDNWNIVYPSTTDYVNEYMLVEIPLEGKYTGNKVQIEFYCSTGYYSFTYIDDVSIVSVSSAKESKIVWSDNLTKQGPATFEGTVSTDWNTAANWSIGEVPGAGADVIINADAVISSDANINVKNLNIKSGNLTIEGVLAVTGTITNNGNLIINDGAELFQNNEDINATFNMNIISPDNWESNNQKGWQFISSPFVDATVASFIPSEGEYDLYKYDGTQEFEWVNHKGGNSDVPETGAETEFFFDFESGTFEGLRSIDGDGDGEEWYLLNHSGYEGIDGGYALNSSCYQNTELYPENYIVTTQKYAITETSTFSFFHIQSDAGYYNEYISVVISRDNLTFEPIYGYDYNNILLSDWKEEIVQLNEYAGEELYLGLCHHNCNGADANGIKVDNIRLSSGSRSQTRGTSSFEETFAQGVGYLASYEKAATVALNGKLHPNTSKTWGQYYYNAEKDLANFHLLGNPFSFNMDMSKLNSFGMVNGYAVVNANGEYEYKTDGIVNVGDGFFVKVKENYATLTYDHSYVAPVLRGSAKANSINIIASGKAGKDNVVFNFAGKAEGFNKLQNFNDAIATVYVSENGKHYGIANVDENTTEVALNFNAKEMGNYSISLDVNGEFETVTLVDRFTGVETNMLLEDEYTFTATSNDNPNRFVIRLDNGQQTTDNGQFVYQSGEELILSIEGHVQIVDMLGRVVYSNEHANGDNRISVSEFNNAAYVVRVINEEGVKTQKVVIY